MNETFTSRLLSLNLEHAIISFHYLVGTVMLFTSVPVCFIVFFDRDYRNKNYKIYALSVQIFSMLAEMWIVMGVPIFLLNHGVVYCAGYVPFEMSSTLYACIFAASFFEISNSYTSCMFYRRNVILQNDHNWRRRGILILLRVSSLITLIAMYLLVERIQMPRENSPKNLWWLFDYSCVMSIIFNGYAVALVIVLFSWAIPLISFFLRLLLESLAEIKKGRKLSSSANTAYQRRAINALLLQAMIPYIVYVIPILTEVIILVYSSVIGVRTALQNQTVAIVSATIFSLITLHSIIHSITTVATSSSHRRTLLRLLCRMNNTHLSLSGTSVPVIAITVH